MPKKICLLILCLFLTFKLSIGAQESKTDNTYSQIKLLLDILTYTKNNYVNEVDTQQLIYNAARGMLSSLDPFTQFMEPESYKEIKIETEGKYGGLGIRITIKDGWITVVSPLIGTPAFKLGILPEDKIIKIDGESAYGITMSDALKKLRGDPGTKVTITVQREGVKEPIDFTIIREIIKLETLKSRIIKDDIGYIHLYEFNVNSENDLKNTIDDLLSKGIKSIIFDLRNNPGGLLDVAVSVVKLFIGDEKIIVYTKGRIPESVRYYYANKKAPFSDLPMIVLVNRGSASGSEIVAGALQDHKRALIIGSRTFGKASVQTVIPLENGCGLRLTTAKYYTPAGRLIQYEKDKKGGIEPDITIDVKPEIEAKLIMQEEIVYPEGKEPPEKQKEKVEDVVLSRAIEFLKVKEIFSKIQK